MCRPCGCVEECDSRWEQPVSITMCKPHWNEMQVDLWLTEWLLWLEDYDQLRWTKYERAAAREITFWASRAAF